MLLSFNSYLYNTPPRIISPSSYPNPSILIPTFPDPRPPKRDQKTMPSSKSKIDPAILNALGIRISDERTRMEELGGSGFVRTFRLGGFVMEDEKEEDGEN